MKIVLLSHLNLVTSLSKYLMHFFASNSLPNKSQKAQNSSERNINLKIFMELFFNFKSRRESERKIRRIKIHIYTLNPTASTSFAI